MLTHYQFLNVSKSFSLWMKFSILNQIFNLHRNNLWINWIGMYYQYKKIKLIFNYKLLCMVYNYFNSYIKIVSN